MAHIRQHNEDDSVNLVRDHEECMALLRTFVAVSGFPETVQWAERMLAGDCDYFVLTDGEYLMWHDDKTGKTGEQTTMTTRVVQYLDELNRLYAVTDLIDPSAESRMFLQRRTAARCADRLNLLYGAHRYAVDSVVPGKAVAR